MKHRSIIALAALAAMILSAVPLVSDGSDAYVITEGSTAAGYSVSNLSDEDLKMIFTEAGQLEYAKRVLDTFADDSWYYDITEVAVTEYTASQYKGDKVSGKESRYVESTDISFKISFKAVCNTDGSQVFENLEVLSDVAREVGLGTGRHVGDEFTVSTTVTDKNYRWIVEIYEINSEGDFVKTYLEDNASSKRVYTSDVEYKYKVGTEEKKVSFGMETGRESTNCEEETYDFVDVKIEDVRDSTYGFVTFNADPYMSRQWEKSTFNDKEKIREDLNKGPSYYFNKAYDNADIVYGDIAPEVSVFYEEYYGGLFNKDSYIDDSLRDNTKMKDFLSSKGTVTENYDDVKTEADKVYADYSPSEGKGSLDLLVIAGIVSFAVIAVAAVVSAVILLKRR